MQIFQKQVIFLFVFYYIFDFPTMHIYYNEFEAHKLPLNRKTAPPSF